MLAGEHRDVDAEEAFEADRCRARASGHRKSFTAIIIRTFSDSKTGYPRPAREKRSSILRIPRRFEGPELLCTATELDPSRAATVFPPLLLHFTRTSR